MRLGGIMGMADIRLFVCCHRPGRIPEHPLLVPIQAGAALADARFPGFLHDDAGENISAKNRSYCELTAQYWAWKNAEADYLGFFHYRRYLYPDIAAKRPYRIEREPSGPLLDRLGYDRFGELIRQYDLIAPIGEDMYVPVREHYAQAPCHHRRDLETVEQILRERHPEMAEALETHLSGTVCYFGNIYIMRREIFRRYCAWLFPLLEEFDRRTDFSGYTPQERRVDGYLAERLFGVYLTFRRDGLKTLELPRAHFYDRREYFRRSLLNAALPPGSRRRSAVKAMERKMKNV